MNSRHGDAYYVKLKAINHKYYAKLIDAQKDIEKLPETEIHQAYVALVAELLCASSFCLAQAIGITGFLTGDFERACAELSKKAEEMTGESLDLISQGIREAAVKSSRGTA